MQITASQFSDKPCNASISAAQSCNYESAAISRYISETVQASTKVTTECKYNAECKCAVAYTPLFYISISFHHTSCSCYVLAHVCMCRPICVCVLFIFLCLLIVIFKHYLLQL